MLYEIYGLAHRTAKRLLGRTKRPVYRMVDVETRRLSKDGTVTLPAGEMGAFFNERLPGDGLTGQDVYPRENIVPLGSCQSLPDSFRKARVPREGELGVAAEEAEALWRAFIQRARIPAGYRNAGLYYGGYILDCEGWCLPSWIWTSAAAVRMQCETGDVSAARETCDRLIALQQPCGGWIVRNDYDSRGAVPILAPNDSAYIAHRACLAAYRATGEQRYLDSAEKCARWIMETAREDGMVYVGCDMRTGTWQTRHNIVDVGFTAGLFAALYEATGREAYREFLKRFTERYIALFYLPEKRSFCTSLDAGDRPAGGRFGRGQAWALEGLIPAYRVLGGEALRAVIDDTVSMLLESQHRSGGWAYDLAKPLLGVDCKATPIIALAIAQWRRDDAARAAVKRAYEWTLRHTARDGDAAGGIFSYTMEGAIVHHFYTWTAFVYASAYAIELKKTIEEG